MSDRRVSINIDLGMDASEFKKELEDLERDIKPINIAVEFDVKEINEVIESASSVIREINKAISELDSFGNLIKTGGLSAVEAGFKEVLNAMTQQLSSALKGIMNTVLAPIKETFSGIFSQLGMSISQAFSNTLVQSIEKSLNVSAENIGQMFGEKIGGFLKKIFSRSEQPSGAPPPQEQVPDLYKKIFEQTAAASGVKVDKRAIPKISTDLEEGAAAKYSQSKNTVFLSKSDYAKLKSGRVDLIGVDSLVHEFRHALQLNLGQQGKNLGVNLLKGTKAELDKLNNQINASTAAAGRGQSSEVIKKIRELESDAYVFALRNAEKIYNNISGKGNRNSLSDFQKQIRNEVIKSQEAVQNALSQQNRAALEQLTKAQLLQIAKSSGISGVSKLRVAELRNKLFDSIAPDDLSFRIPTFSRPSAEIASLTQSLLSQPLEGIKSTINNFSSQMKSVISSKSTDSASLRKALDSIQTQRQTYAAALSQDIDKQTRDAIKAAIARLGKQRIALQSKLTIADSEILNQRASGKNVSIPQNVSLYSMSPGSGQSKYAAAFANTYRQAGDKIYNNPRFAGMGEVERRSVVAEAGGYIFSGAAMAAPIQTAIASLAPIAIPLTPVLVTGALVANVISPILAAVQQTLEKTEPIRRRLESLFGVEGAKRESDFARSVASELGTSVLTSMQSYSQLVAATKNTALEGENTKELFKGVSAAVKALGMDTESTRLIFYAFSQMASKGVISMEELRQQLGERFPIALDVFARAAGVSQADLGKLIESGKLLAADILPKVAQQLQRQYGQAAKSSVDDFISSQIKLENAIFNFQEKLAKAFGPLLAGMTNTFSVIVNLVGNNMENLTKILGVTLIGLGAQFLVGTTVILGRLQVISTAIAAIAPVVGAVMATLTPMIVGIGTDMMDEIFGVTSAFENISLGFYNFFASLVTAVIAGAEKINQVLNGVTFSASKTVDVLGAVAGAFSALRRVIPDVVIELVALTLMLNQTTVLGQMALGPILASMGTSLKLLGASFIAAARSGQLFQVTMNTLAAGLTRTQVATMGALAAFLLFFAKAKFTNEIGSGFDKLTEGIVSGSERIGKALTFVGDKIKQVARQKNEFESQGFDLTFGIGQQFGGGAYRTDDVIKFMRGEEEIKKMLAEGRITQKEFDDYMQAAMENSPTFSEKLYQDNILKLTNLQTEVEKTIDLTGLLSNTYKSNDIGKAIDSVKNIDPQIKALQQERVELVSREDAATNAAIRDRVKTLDSSIQSLLKQREESIKPIKVLNTELDNYRNSIQAELDSVQKRIDLPKQAKDELVGRLTTILGIIDIARKRFKNVGVDLVPNLGVDFQKVSQQIEGANRQLEKTLGKNKKNLAKESSDLQDLLSQGNISKPLFDNASIQLEIDSLKTRTDALSNYIKNRKEHIKQLMLLPSPTKEQQDVIAKGQQALLEKEEEFFKAQEELQKKIAESQSKRREEKLKDFDEAIQIQENYQKLGLASERQSIDAIMKIRVMKAQEELAQIRERRNKLNKTDKDGLEALAVQESEVYARMADARQTRFDEQIELVKTASSREMEALDAQQKQGLISEEQVANQRVAIAEQAAKKQITMLRARLPEARTNTQRQELILQEQQLAAAVAEERKAAYQKSQSEIQSREQAEIAQLTASRSQSLLTERQFNEQQYKIKLQSFDEQLKLLRDRRSKLNATDVQGLRELQKAEAEIIAARTQAQQAFLDAQISQLERSQAKAKDVLLSSTKETEISIQRLLNERIINQEEAQAYLNQASREAIALELRQEEEKSRQLASIRFSDPIAEKDRQAKIRQSRIRTSELTLQLLQNDKQQQEDFFNVLTKAYERFNQQVGNGATQLTLPLQRQVELSNALEKSFEIQNNLLQARKGLYTAFQNYLQSEYQILQDTAKSEREKQQYAKEAADAKLQAAITQVNLDKQSLELQIQQAEAAQRRLQIENAIAQIKNQADIAARKADLATTQANPNATAEQVDAARLQLAATEAEGLGLREQAKILKQEATANSEINRAKREAQDLEGRSLVRKAQFEAANAIRNPRERREALKQLRAEALSATRRPTPLQSYFSQSAIPAQIPGIPLPQVLNVDNLSTNIDNFGAAVNTLMNFVNSKLSTPTQVTINAPVTNNIDSRNAKNIDVTGEVRKQFYDLGLELNRK